MKSLSYPNDFCPLKPAEKQRLFLKQRALEVFFGGAAGGGKSAALLMAALQYAHEPGYAALIIRKDLPRLALAGGLIPRSHEWLSGSEAKWNHARRQWQFPSDDGPAATLTFGYLARPLDKYRYASSEFQYIAFDELTDFCEDDYLFLFSRLRRVKGCKIPLRMRSASNPGGLGHAWVKQRFIPEEAGFGVQGEEESKVQSPRSRVGKELGVGVHGEEAKGRGQEEVDPADGVFCREGRIYIPSRIADNPALDEAEYRGTLLHLPPLVRERLMNGDWSVQEQGLIQADWLRYYVEGHSQLELLEPSGRSIAVVPEGSCRRFVTIDPAGTSAERTKAARGREPSWTVVQVWDQPRRPLGKYLLLRHQVRKRVGYRDLCQAIRDVQREWLPAEIYIEGEKLGVAVKDSLKDEMEIELLSTQCKDKEARAGELLHKLARGEVFLPRYENGWRPGFEAELLAWTGDERQVTDQIDAAAYAAIVASRRGAEVIRIGPAVCRS